MPSAAIREQLAAFQALKTDLFQKDFLLTWEHPADEIKAILTLAETFKRLHQEGYSYRAFDTGLAISIFRDNSTRTRFSFASAASALGLSLVGPRRAEEPDRARRDGARDRQHDQLPRPRSIGIRDDMFLGEGNKYMREVGDALTDGAEQGVLHRRPEHRQPPVRRRPPDPVARRPGLAEEALRRPREPAGQEDRDDLGLQPELRQAALGAAGRSSAS